jgi:hypothetical protein
VKRREKEPWERRSGEVRRSYRPDGRPRVGSAKLRRIMARKKLLVEGKILRPHELPTTAPKERRLTRKEKARLLQAIHKGTVNPAELASLVRKRYPNPKRGQA